MIVYVSIDMWEGGELVTAMSEKREASRPEELQETADEIANQLKIQFPNRRVLVKARFPTAEAFRSETGG